MTDLPDPLDELASAHLDGATTAEEAARIAADPSLQARVDELRVARDALQTAVAPVEPAQRDAAVAAALAAFHEDGRTTPPVTARVTSLAEVAARRRTPGLALRVLGAAAVLVLVALLVPLLARQGDDDAETADASSEDADQQETVDDAADGGSEAPASEGGTGSEAAGGADAPVTTRGALYDQVGPLGAFADVDALAAAITRQPDRLLETTQGLSDLACVQQRDTAFSSSGVVIAAEATVAGAPVQVVVVTDEDGARTMTVLRADTCTVVATRDL